MDCNFPQSAIFLCKDYESIEGKYADRKVILREIGEFDWRELKIEGIPLIFDMVKDKRYKITVEEVCDIE